MNKEVCPKRVKNLEVDEAKKIVSIGFDTEDLRMSFRFVSKEIINIIYGQVSDGECLEISEANIKKSPALHVNEGEKELIVSNGFLKLIIYKDPFYYEIQKNNQTLIKQAIDDMDIVGGRYSDMLTYKYAENQVSAIKDSFSITHDEKFYGFGEKFSPINKRGLNVEAWNYDAMGVGSDKAYKNIPFFMNSKNYGVFINTTCRINYSLGSDSFDSYSIEVKDSCFNYYFITGDSFKEIVSRYMDLTGRMEILPPKWSFGLWIGKYGYVSRQEVEATGAAFREYDVPLDIISIDPFWMKNGHYCDLVFNEDAYPNPKEMFSELRKKGFKTRVWIQPTVSSKTEMFKEGEKEGYLLKTESGDTYLWQSPLPNQPEGLDTVDFTKMDVDALGLQPLGGIIDFSNPDAVKWFLAKLEYLINWGAGLFMCDFGEEIPEDTHFFNGKTGKEMHNIYSSIYASAVYNFIKEKRTEAPICLIRSGWTGLHRYPICWSGDPKVTWEAMLEVLRGGLSLALTGVAFWSHDIGGTAAVRPDPKLYLRWMQLGMFTSHTRCHGMYPKEPWHVSDEAVKIFRKFDKLRYSLIPYIYSCAWECLENDIPFIKPLVLEYQDDPIAQECDDEYIFGNSFLAAPIFTDKDSRHVYLPEGKWIDYWTKTIYEGGRVYLYEAPIDIMPLFVKSGSIIPMQEEISFIADEPLNKMILDIYPDGKSEFRYKDDYESFIISVISDEKTVKVDIEDAKKEYTLKLNGCKGKNVEVNGKPVNADVQQDSLTLKL